MLDDGDGRRLEVAGNRPGGVQVQQVIERQVLAGNLARAADTGPELGGIGVEGAQLVRVLAVAQVRLLLHHQREAAGEQGARLLVQVAGHLRVVGSGQGEGLGRELLPRLRADRALRLQIPQHAGVLGLVAHGRHAGEVLSRCSKQGHAADVDLVERLVQGRVGLPHGLGEG